MEVADGDAVLGLAAEGAEVHGADVDGLTELVESGLRLCVEGFFVVGKLDAAFPVGLLDGEIWGQGEAHFASLMGSTPARLYVRSSVRSSGPDCSSFHFCCASSRVLGSHFAARLAAFFWLFQRLYSCQCRPESRIRLRWAYALYSAESMFMSASRSSSDMSPLSTSALRSAMTFRISSSFGSLRDGVVEKGREACVIYKCEP